MDFKKVENHSDLVRDVKSNAIINKDEKALQQYLEKKALLATKEQRIEHLEKDVKDIKETLNKILEKLT